MNNIMQSRVFVTFYFLFSVLAIFSMQLYYQYVSITGGKPALNSSVTILFEHLYVYVCCMLVCNSCNKETTLNVSMLKYLFFHKSYIYLMDSMAHNTK